MDGGGPVGVSEASRFALRRNTSYFGDRTLVAGFDGGAVLLDLNLVLFLALIVSIE